MIPSFAARFPSTDSSVLAEKRGRRGAMLTYRLVWRIGIDELFEERSYKQTAIARCFNDAKADNVDFESLMSNYLLKTRHKL